MKWLAAILSIIFWLSLHSIEYETANLKDFIYGSSAATAYDNWISHVIEGDGHSDYAYAPFDEQSTAFGEYQVPTANERTAWNSIVDYFIAGLYGAAAEVITFNNFSYEIVEFTDLESGKELMILREQIDTTYVDTNDNVNGFEERGAFHFGWGTFILDINSHSNKIINVVHPSDDFIAPVIATHAFLEGDFKWLMLNGASRGALMNGSISVSDPSREYTHPFNEIYAKICQQINQTHQHKVHSIQLHSYDFNSSNYVKNVHLSNKSIFPSLPIYDHSSQHNSLVQNSPYQIHPLLAFGNTSPINVNDYYSICSNDNDDLTYDYNGQEIDIFTTPAYIGYGGNIQYYLTYVDDSAYDVLGRFLHVELAEKPKHIESYIDYKRFYALDVEANQYNFEERFSQAIEFYQPFIDALNNIYPDIDELDDGLPPTDIENFNLSFMNFGETTFLEFFWDPTDSYDFDSYELYIGNEPYNEDSELIDRNQVDNFALAQTAYYQHTSGLDLDSELFVQLRARDKNGNLSNWASYHYLEKPVTILDNSQIGIETEVELIWYTEYNFPYDGFKLYRRAMGERFQLIASHLSDSNLIAVAGDESFEFTDSNLIPDLEYQYQISSVIDDQEYFHESFAPIRTNLLHKLYISDYSETVVDTLYFGEADNNLFKYRISKSYEESDIFSGFTVNNNYSQRLFFERFNHAEESISILLALENNTENDSLKISADYQSDLNDLYLWEHATDNYYSLAEAEVLLEVDYPVVEDNWSLVWGDLRPEVSFNPTANNYIVGNQLDLDFDFFAGNLIEEYSLYLETENEQILLGTYNEINENISLEITDEMLCNRGELSCEFAFNGDQYRVLANHKINILPTDFTINYPVGWSLTTYYDTTVTDPVSAFPGVEDIIAWAESYYNPVEINFPDSFWLSLAQAENYTPLAASAIIAQSVQPGWNLYSNQAWNDINKENLTFNIAGKIYSYQELHESGVCAYDIIGFRDGEYQSIDSINVGEAFWFYFYPTVELDNFYLADLFPDNSALPAPVDDITSVTIHYNEADSPIKLGIKPESANEIEVYDLPAPPPPPFNQSQIYIATDEQNVYQGKLAVDYRQYNPNQEHYECDFYINHGDFDIVNLGVEINQTIGYNYWLYWGVDIYDLSNSSSLELTCFTEEISTGKLVIEQTLGGESELSLNPDLICYPNPFLPNNSRQGFQLQFSLQEPAKIELGIYNIKGQIVKLLIKDKLETGNYNFVWDGKDAAGKQTASGVYLIKFARGKEISASKMLLLK